MRSLRPPKIAQASTTIGLLHDIGQGVRILMKTAHPDQTDKIDGLPPEVLGARLLRLWGLPDRICTVVEKQALPEFTPPDMIQADLGVKSASCTLLTFSSPCWQGMP